MIDLRAILLLADRRLLRDMGSGFREKREHFDATDLFFWFLIVVGIFIALGVLARVLGRHDKHRLYNSPGALFRALCRAHGLDHRARQLLRQIARSQQISPPARVFVEPACLKIAQASSEFQGRRAALDALAAKLFAQIDAGPVTAGPVTAGAPTAGARPPAAR